jgi:hypothetical protein
LIGLGGGRDFPFIQTSPGAHTASIYCQDQRKGKAVPLVPFWAFMVCSGFNFTQKLYVRISYIRLYVRISYIELYVRISYVELYVRISYIELQLKSHVWKSTD